MVKRATFDTAEEICDWIRKSPKIDWAPTWRSWPAVQEAYRMLAARFIKSLPTSPPFLWSGDGIVMLGGGRYWDSAYVTIRMIRHVGCRLPIQLWHMRGEISRKKVEMLQPYGVECIDADEVREQYPMRTWGGWQAKPFAIYHSRFNRVLYLDSDCYPVKDPTQIFSDPQVLATGALFFPDGAPQLLPARTWEMFGLQYRHEAAFESGQLWVDKGLCHQELALTIHYNEHSDYYYKWDSHEDPERIVYGDKDLFHMAWRSLGRDYTMFHDMPLVTPECYLHRDASGEVMFVHRCKNKFCRTLENFPTAQTNTCRRDELPLEDVAWTFFEELKKDRPSLTPVPTNTVVRPSSEIKITKLIGHPISSGACFNPGLILYKDKRLLVYRMGHYNAQICVAELDANWQPMSTWPLPRWNDRSAEDPRVFLHNDKLHMSYTDYDGHIASVGLATLGEDCSVESACIPDLHGRQFWEKNWAFFSWNGELFCVYSIQPHQILHVRDGKAWRVWRTDFKTCNYGEPRGGAPPVLHNGEMYHFFHSVSCEGAMRIYGIGVYTFAPHPPFEIRRFGVQPIMTADPADVDGTAVPCAIFPAGAIRHENKWLLSCGYLDRECQLVQIPDHLVESLLQ